MDDGATLELTKHQAYFRKGTDFPHTPEPQTPAADVLLALTRCGPLLDEIAADAAARPLTRFPVNWTQRPASMIAMPHANFIQLTCVTLRLRACAELAAGRTDDALRDILLGLRLCRALAAEPTLIAQLVHFTSLRLMLQPVWEGLAARRWSAEQLSELQPRLCEVDLIEGYQKAARGERDFFFLPMRMDLHTTKGVKQMLKSIENRAGEYPEYRIMVRMIPWFPAGWLDESEAALCDLCQRNVIDLIDPRGHRIFAKKFDEGEDTVRASPMRVTTFLPKFCLPIYLSVATKTARVQAGVDEAATACALEKYYLEHGSYPDQLDVLVPNELARVPTDVIDGETMRYATTPGGRYRLWEVGWNGVDENGTVAFKPGTKATDDRSGDWVWQYEAVAIPAGK